MGKNIVRKEFVYDGTWNCPAGVTQVKVLVFNTLRSPISGACALANGGTLYAWGVYGSAGTVSSSPILISGPTSWREISGLNGINGGIFIGVASNGDGYAFGSGGGGGQTGNPTGQVAIPTIVSGGIKWRSIVGGGDTSIGISATGQLYGWGVNGSGQIGDGTVVNKSSPTAVLSAGKFLSCAVSYYGDDNSGAIDVSGNAYTWGTNGAGQLGLGDVIPRSSPVLVLGGKTWSSISMGGAHTLLLDTNGNAYAMGSNGSGALGDGTVVTKSSPVAVIGGKKFKSIKAFPNNGAGASSNLAITTDGDLYSWGNNSNGQLGLGDVTNRSSPVIIPGGKKWLHLGVSQGASYAMDSSANIYAWGYNGMGQLGTSDAVTTSRSTPTLISASENGTIYGQAMSNILVNESLLSVTPGSSYAVSVFGGIVMMNWSPLFQDPYNSGAVVSKVVLEYAT